MRFLRIISVIALTAQLVAATCVVNVEQKGADGPWVGEVVNMGDHAIHGAAAQAHIFDADGRDLHGQVGVLACPWMLLPGERGAFELFETDPDFSAAPGAPEVARLPLRAELRPSEDLNVGTGVARGDGLLVREVERNDAGSRVRVEVWNHSVARYSEVTVCAVLRDFDGKLLEVARSDGPRLPASLLPGEMIALDLHFFSLPAGRLRYYAAGMSDAPYADCCPPNGASPWTSVKNQAFSVLLPPGWAYEPLPGIDSFVGRYYSDSAELIFDYGIYSDPLMYEDDTAYEVHEETIAGVTAKVVRAKGAQGITGVHFADVGRFAFPGDNIAFEVRLTISAQDLTRAEQAIAVQILRSVRFAQ
jgi:hypothetical protein